MKLHVLIDNLPSQENPALHHEHGLSILLQTPEGKNYLIDTGASGKFIENLEILRQADSSLPSVEEIDAVISVYSKTPAIAGWSVVNTLRNITSPIVF